MIADGDALVTQLVPIKTEVTQIFGSFNYCYSSDKGKSQMYYKVGICCCCLNWEKVSKNR